MTTPADQIRELVSTAGTADETTERVLDAALNEFSEYGIRRTSIESVARRAGLGRMTVYRRFAGKDVLVRAVFMREAGRFLENLGGSIVDAQTASGRIERGFVAGVLAFRDNPLLRRALASEPESTLPYLTSGAGGMMDAAVAFVGDQLAQAADAVRIPPDALAAAAEVTVRLAHSYVLTPPGGRELDATELQTAARRLLRPLVDAGTRGLAG